MRANPIRQLWAEGKWVLNAWCAIPSPFAAEVMANLGWDSVTVDMQHGVNDYQSAVGMFQAISTTDAAPMARVPWNDPAIVMKMLDAGAYGLICPLVNSAEEAERFAKACRYPPRGYRSSGPYPGADLWRRGLFRACRRHDRDLRDDRDHGRARQSGRHPRGGRDRRGSISAPPTSRSRSAASPGSTGPRRWWSRRSRPSWPPPSATESAPASSATTPATPGA